jgi:nitrous oxidase accessory protein NosD
MSGIKPGKVVLMSLLLLVVTAGFAARPQEASQTLTVCPEGPPACQFSKIQEAINAAVEGATILVKSGTYSEHLIISKSLRLVGAGAERTILQGLTEESVISIQNPYYPITVTIQGLRVQTRRGDSPVSEGIMVGRWVQAFLQENIIVGGIFITGQATLWKNTILGRVSVVTPQFATVGLSTLVAFENKISFPEGACIAVGGGGQADIQQNQISQCRYGVLVQSLLGEPWTILEGNEISDSSIGIFLWGGVADIQYNRIIGNEYGIALTMVPCVPREIADVFPFSGKVRGKENEIHDNQKMDLCPADYPWPPGLVKEDSG